MREYFFDLQGFANEFSDIKLGRIAFCKVLLVTTEGDGLTMIGASPLSNRLLPTAVAWTSFCSFLRGIFKKETQEGFKVQIFEIKKEE